MRILLTSALALLFFAGCSPGAESPAKSSDTNLTLLYFEAPWCAPCQGMKSTLPEVLLNQPELFHVQRVDVDRQPNLTKLHDIDAIPALVLLDTEGERGRMVGQVSVAKLDGFFQQALQE